jgi:hypothetical protein
VKSEGAIRHKISQIQYRHLKRRLKQSLRVAPSNCVHNLKAVAPDGTEYGICSLGMRDDPEWQPTFCDEEMDKGERARNCEYFCLKHTKESVKQDFYDELAGMSLVEIAVNYPDLAPLVWALEDEVPIPDDVEPDSFTDEAPLPVEIVHEWQTADPTPSVPSTIDSNWLRTIIRRWWS